MSDYGTFNNGYSSWSNMRLVKSSCETTNIVQDIMKATRIKALLQELTGHVPKGLGSMEGLTAAQKVTRVQWFIDALIKSGKLPKKMGVDTDQFALCSDEHICPVLWMLVCADVKTLWEISPIFQKQANSHLLIANPVQIGPCKISKDFHEGSKPEDFYLNRLGKPMADLYKRNSKDHFYINAPYSLIQLVNGQLKITREGRRLRVKSLKDILDSRVLCALVNSLIPGSFTSEVLLNDRWTVNVTLEAASEVFRVTCQVDSRDLQQSDEEEVCAFLTYFITSGYQFKQAQAVVKRVKELGQLVKDLQIKLEKRKTANNTKKSQVTALERKISATTKELHWIDAMYHCDTCEAWVEHANQVQLKVRNKITQKMIERFDVLVVPHPMTINKLVDSMFINLSLTGGYGLYQANGKEKLYTERRTVVYVKETGEFFEDFSGRKNSNGTVRKMLDVHPHDLIQVDAILYPAYEIFFQSPSRNKILRTGTKFLYQVFPGTTGQCERLLLKSSSAGEISTVKKLIMFLGMDESFVNCVDHETGNTALHLASRNGHFEIALHLLENGASVNLQNHIGCTPFFLSAEALHKKLSQLLLEWGADIHIKNRKSKRALELTRNMTLRDFLEGKYEEYQLLSDKISKGDRTYLDNYLKAHQSKDNPMASLRSRCVQENTLFHISSLLSSKFGIELFLMEHVDPNLLNGNSATPLHMARDPGIIESLLEHGADINMVDKEGNTALHFLSAESSANTTVEIIQCIKVLMSHSSQLDIPNYKNWLPVHTAAAHGFIPALQTFLDQDKDGLMEILKERDLENDVSSLILLALLGDHLDCAMWLSSQGYCMNTGEADNLLLRLLDGPYFKCTDMVETVRFLLKMGANPNTEHKENNTPLHLSAALVSLPEISELLLEAGADVMALNSTQSTPLFSACKANNPILAQKLIERGADCYTTDIDGKCAFDYLNDHEEWINGGHFPDDIRALLKAFSLRHARDVVRAISKTVKVRSMNF